MSVVQLVKLNMAYAIDKKVYKYGAKFYIGVVTTYTPSYELYDYNGTYICRMQGDWIKLNDGTGSPVFTAT